MLSAFVCYTLLKYLSYFQDKKASSPNLCIESKVYLMFIKRDLKFASLIWASPFVLFDFALNKKFYGHW